MNFFSIIMLSPIKKFWRKFFLFIFIDRFLDSAWRWFRGRNAGRTYRFLLILKNEHFFKMWISPLWCPSSIASIEICPRPPKLSFSVKKELELTKINKTENRKKQKRWNHSLTDSEKRVHNENIYFLAVIRLLKRLTTNSFWEWNYRIIK